MEIRISDALTPDRMRRDLVNDMVTTFKVPRADAEQAVEVLFRRIRRELWTALFHRMKLITVFDQNTGKPVGMVWAISEPDSLEVGKELC